VEPDLYRMDYAIIHHSASVLQMKVWFLFLFSTVAGI
jgi:hypothetical protein